MFCINIVVYVTFILLLVSLFTLIENVESRVLAKPCQVRLICKNEEDVVYASEGEKCHVFLNPCELRNENCVRHNFYFKTLEPMESVKCQEMCTDVCATETEAVCAEYQGNFRTFPSYCAWNYHICTSGEMYNQPKPGACR